MTPLLLALLTAWPAPDALLTPPPLPAATPKRKLRVVVDAGHGAPGNHGNEGCHCQLEQDHTLEVARELAAALKQTGRFEVRLARDGALPTYRERLRRIEAWPADVAVSLHSDARGLLQAWKTAPDAGVCFKNDAEPGFAVLWSEEGPASVVGKRETLGRALASRMRDAGFGAYDGVNYGGLYRADDAPGGWVDIHAPKKRIMFLRASTKVPIVIVETHHAMDVAEEARWREPKTREAFAAAVAAALSDYAWPAPAAASATAAPGR